MALVRSTRSGEPGAPAFASKWIAWGAGPRAGQALVLTSKARAALDGRSSVTIDDIRAVALPVLRHRLVTTYAAQAEGETSDSIVAKLLDEVPVRPGAAEVDGQVAHVFRS